MECLESIVGVTKDDTLPFWAALGTEFTEPLTVSTSGLYLDTMPGGIDLTTIDEIDYMRHALTQGKNAITAAEKICKDDIVMKLNSLYKLGKKGFNGNIGRLDTSNNLNTGPKFQGLRLRMKESIGGYITISGIKINVNGSQTFDLKIAQCNAKDKFATVINTFSITTVASTFTAAAMGDDAPLKLPMQVQGIPQEYWIYYDRTQSGTSLLPKNNEIKCKCPNDPVHALHEYMEVSGVAFNAIDNIQSVGSDSYAHGISIAAKVSCDSGVVICREYDNSEPLAIAMAWATTYKASELWIEYLFKTNFVSREMLQSREYLWGKRNHYKAEYMKRIDYIGANLSLNETNCYICSDSKAFFGKIKA